MCVDALVIKLLERFKFIITMVVSDGENHVAVLLKTGFKPEIISVSPLLLHDCTDMKYIFIDLVCRKGLPFTKNKSIYRLWWYLVMGGGKGFLGIVL